MPQYKQSCPVEASDIPAIMDMAYGALEQLGWNAKFAGEARLVGYTPRSWKTYGEEILIDILPNEITVSSTMTHNESWDITRRNKKNVERFLQAFGDVESSATPEQATLWQQQVAALQQQTIIIAEEEMQAAEEAEKIMKASAGSRRVTYTIIGINILVFIAMAVSGVSITEPTLQQLVNWGANYKPYTTGGEWWRLVTCVFVHIGIIHLLFNMYALYIIGNYLEPMLGRVRYTAAYISTGIFASLFSIWWHNDEAVSAGASGAIFGLYGLFLALLTTSLIPTHVRKALLQSIAIFVGYNLLYGLKSGVDNAAHLGGLISGFALGYLYYPSLKNQTDTKGNTMAGMAVMASAVAAFLFLKINTDDSRIYQQRIQQFSQLEEKALQPLKDSTATVDQLSQQLEGTSLPTWQQTKKLWEETKVYKLNGVQTKQRQLLDQYIDLRIQQTHLLLQSLSGQNTAGDELQQVNTSINNKIDSLGKL